MFGALGSAAFGIPNFLLFLAQFVKQALKYDGASIRPYTEKRALKSGAAIALAVYNATTVIILVYITGYFECDVGSTGYCPTFGLVVRFAFIIMSLIFTVYEEVYKRFNAKRPAVTPLYLFATILSLHTISVLWVNIWWFRRTYPVSTEVILRFILNLARIVISSAAIHRFGKKWATNDTIIACLATATVIIGLLWQAIGRFRLIWWAVPSLYLELTIFQLMAISRMRYARRSKTVTIDTPESAPVATHA